MDLRNSEQLLPVVLSTFCGQNKCLKKNKTIVESVLKTLESFSFWVKIGYHSCFNPECNTERCYIESLSIALGNYQIPLQVSVTMIMRQTVDFFYYL